jgi:hypothetical protein
VAKRVPIADLKSAITRCESALGDGLNLIENFQKLKRRTEKALRIVVVALVRRRYGVSVEVSIADKLLHRGM